MYQPTDFSRRTRRLAAEALEERQLLAVDLVADIAPGTDSSRPTELTVAGQNLFFVADDGTSGRELWRMDMSGNASLVHDVTEGPRSSNLLDVTAVGEEVWFFRNDLGKYELWKTSERGSQAELVSPISERKGNALNVNGQFAFTTSASGVFSVWTADATGIQEVSDIPDFLTESHVAGDELYFINDDKREIWHFDWTTRNVVPHSEPSWWNGAFHQQEVVGREIRNLIELDGKLGFELCGKVRRRSTCQWYTQDGDVQPYLAGKPLSYLQHDRTRVSFEGAIYFAHSETETGTELYREQVESIQADQTVWFSQESFVIDESGVSLGAAISVIRSSGEGIRQVEVLTTLDSIATADVLGFSGRYYESQEYIVTFQEDETEIVIPISAFTDREIEEFQADVSFMGLEGETAGESILTLRDDRLFQDDRQVSLRLWQRDLDLMPLGVTQTTIEIRDNEGYGANAFDTNGNTLIVVDGESDTFDVQLALAPTEVVTVEVEYDEALIVANPTRFEFTPENWNEPQDLYVQGRSANALTSIQLTSSSGTGELSRHPSIFAFELSVTEPPRFDAVSPNLELTDWNFERIRGMYSTSDALYLGADSGDFDTNLQLWKITDSGETLLVHEFPEELQAYNGSIGRFVPAGDKLFFTLEWIPQCYRLCGTIYDWWETDGTREGTHERIPSYSYYDHEYETFGWGKRPRYHTLGPDGALYYENGQGRGFKFDGTTVRTLPGSPSNFYVHNGSMYFVDQDEVWRTDDGFETKVLAGGEGVTGDTVGLASAGDSLYFSGDAVYNTLIDEYAPSSVYRVRAHDGIAERILQDQREVWRLVEADRQLFIFSSEGLWVVEDDVATPQLLESTSFDSSFDGQVHVVVDGVLYFLSWSSPRRYGLWRSDGTNEGTFPLSNVGSGVSLSLTVVAGKVFFAKESGAGSEVWVTDGTREGTELYREREEGQDSIDFGNLAGHGDHLYFTATDSAGDSKLWRSNVERAFADPLPGDADGDQSVTFADFLVLSSNFGQTTDAGFAAGDFDESGNVDMDDFLLLAANFGK